MTPSGRSPSVVASVPFRVEEATIASIHAAIRAGEISCRDVVDAYLRRIAAYDKAGPKLNTIVVTNPHALSRARDLDDSHARAGTLSGALHGIPVLVKDCIETRAMPTRFGSISAGDYRPTADAAVIRRLQSEGAIVLAKTTMPDFAASWFSYSSATGDTKNPYALERDSGGSSAGSAAGVAANFGCVGIGTDCGGSIRVPASFNNLVGLRPTFGRVSRAGTSVLLELQDVIGPLARSAADAATVMEAIAGYDPADPCSAAATIATPAYAAAGAAPAQLAGARIGVLRQAFGSDSAVDAVVDGALERLAAAGAVLVDVQVPDLAGQLEATSLYQSRMRHDIDAFLGDRRQLPVRSLREIHDRGLYDRRLDLVALALDGPDDPDRDPDVLRRHLARVRFNRTLVGVLAANYLEALAYPSVQVIAPLRDGPAPQTLSFPTNTVIASQGGLPAVSVPAGFTDGGFPVGLELAARPYDEATLLRLAAAIERLAETRRPPLSAPELAASAA